MTIKTVIMRMYFKSGIWKRNIEGNCRLLHLFVSRKDLFANLDHKNVILCKLRLRKHKFE